MTLCTLLEYRSIESKGITVQLETFERENFHKLVKKDDFHRENFHRLLMCAAPNDTIPKFCGENFCE